MKKLSALAAFAVLLAAPALAQVAGQPVSIVAAENFYGDIAKQIGGPDVKVTSILSNPDQDPHLFEVSPSVGRDVSAARIVIYNGIDYDPWMEKLLGAARSTKRETIVVADLVGKKTGDNPHIWYDPATMAALAKTLSEALTADDPGHKAGYEQRLRAVLAGVSLKIAPRELVGVLGPNGAGKTTLMRAVLGLVPASQGSIHVLGRPAARGNQVVGYMPQVRSAAGIMRLSGWDFVAGVVDGHRLGMPILGKAARAEVVRVLDLVGAGELARRPLAETSSGERQRLLLAQTLIGRPRLLLLDEPLISLDPHYQRDVVELAKSLQAELGITILFSAHELNPLLGVLHRVLYLGRGQAALGTVDEVITGPVLSRLYGTEIDVVRLKGRIFVMSGGHDVERDEHRHNDRSMYAHDIKGARQGDA